ncbi:serine hydrolase domain-containing protein [Algoriphagus boritolerans]|uniref:serine hydrolase domain-containing protein n=1 Tax=Algoriphagus boritolerans TaxID=308111 RepID=UPI002FCE4192
MKPFSFFLLFLTGLIWTNPTFAQQKILESALIQAESNGFSGVVLVAQDGKILLEKAIGFRTFENQTPLQTTDIFEMASISKQFTAMILMMCKEKKDAFLRRSGRKIPGHPLQRNHHPPFADSYQRLT